MLTTDTGRVVSRTDVLDVYACPLCAALPGQPCTRWNRKALDFSGSARVSLHMERWKCYPGLRVQ